MPKTLDRFVLKRARRDAKRRGLDQPNFSAALSDMVVEARNKSKDNGNGKAKA